MAILTVGPGKQFAKIEQAVVAAKAGDTVQVQAGTYTNDFVGIYKSITLQAVNGEVRMLATASPPNRKAIIDEGGNGLNITINGFDISGAKVADGNGAAVRYEGGRLTLNNDYFHNNQEGLLGANDPNGVITINHSEFAFNGTGTGSTHNLYVGKIANLTVNNSYFHDVPEGHQIKSRALTTVITGNRIFDNTSTSSYSIDIPNAGNLTIRSNVIEQGKNAHNPNIIAYGEEGASNAGRTVSIAGNTIVNDLVSASTRVVMNRSTTALPFTSNSLWGLTASQLANGPLSASGSVFLASRPALATAPLTFVNPVTTGTVAGLLAGASMTLADIAPSQTAVGAATTTSVTAGTTRGEWIPGMPPTANDWLAALVGCSIAVLGPGAWASSCQAAPLGGIGPRSGPIGETPEPGAHELAARRT